MTDDDHPAKIHSITYTALLIARMLMKGAVSGLFNPAQP
jgi:hypothetical protein